MASPPWRAPARRRRTCGEARAWATRHDSCGPRGRGRMHRSSHAAGARAGRRSMQTAPAGRQSRTAGAEGVGPGVTVSVGASWDESKAWVGSVEEGSGTVSSATRPDTAAPSAPRQRAASSRAASGRASSTASGEQRVRRSMLPSAKATTAAGPARQRAMGGAVPPPSRRLTRSVCVCAEFGAASGPCPRRTTSLPSAAAWEAWGEERDPGWVVRRQRRQGVVADVQRRRTESQATAGSKPRMWARSQFARANRAASCRSLGGGPRAAMSQQAQAGTPTSIEATTSTSAPLPLSKSAVRPLEPRARRRRGGEGRRADALAGVGATVREEMEGLHAASHPPNRSRKASSLLCSPWWRTSLAERTRATPSPVTARSHGVGGRSGLVRCDDAVCGEASALSPPKSATWCSPVAARRRAWAPWASASTAPVRRPRASRTSTPPEQ